MYSEPEEISLEEELRRRRERQAAAEGKPPGGWRAKADPPPAPDANGAAAPDEEEGGCVAYGFRRGVRERVHYCEFQLLKGDWLAPGYHWLPCPKWVPSGDKQGRGQKIVLAYLTGLTITLRGRNLRALYDRLLRQQVYRVTEMGEEVDHWPTPPAEAVYAIDVEEPKPPAPPGSR